MFTRLSWKKNLEKIIFFVLILLFSTACSKISKRSEIVFNDHELIAFYNYYDNWKLIEAEEELNQLEIENEKKDILMQKLTIRENNRTEFKQVQNNLGILLQKNDFDAIEKYVDLNIINEIKLNELKKNDYSKVKIYFGKNKFYKENAETLMLVNYMEETVYIDLEFRLSNSKEWKLISFSERR